MKKEAVKNVSRQINRVVLVKHVYLGRVTCEEAMARLVVNHKPDKTQLELSLKQR